MQDRPIPFLEGEPNHGKQPERASHLKKSALFLVRCAVVSAALGIAGLPWDGCNNERPAENPGITMEDVQKVMSMSEAEQMMALHSYFGGSI